MAKAPYQPPVQSKFGQVFDSLFLLALVMAALFVPLYLGLAGGGKTTLEMADKSWAGMQQNATMQAQWEKLGYTDGAEAKDGKKPEKTPLFSGITTFGGLVFIAGIGAHFEGDIKAHTDHVLKEIQKRLEEVGSSMEKVLKVNVYLNDLKDYAAMNEVFLGRFGAEPGVRTTIAAAGGIPGNSLVEIDCIACI